MVMEKFAVTVDHLHVRFGDFYAVEDVSFSVKEGAVFGFLGANGAGKTTTIRVLCGLLVPNSGEVVIDSEPLLKGKESEIKKKVGYMSQKFTLYDDLSIDENLDFAASLRQIRYDTYLERKQSLLEFIGFDQDLNMIVADLPGGQKQEIALIASVLHDPKIVFLDEPTAGVAPAARKRFWNLVQKLAQTGKTIFVTTHYMDEAENCDMIALMRTGKLIALNSPQNLKRDAYQKQIYSLTPKSKEGYELLMEQWSERFSMLEPYGQHFHVVVHDDFAEDETIELIANFCHVRSIEPSLEDVFVKLVSGDSR
jgi:ABC-2 type transport system ATP-binding protein